MKIEKIVKKILIHIAIITSIVQITAAILDWYNPYMNFSGHALFTRWILMGSIILGIAAFFFFRIKNNEKKRKRERKDCYLHEKRHLRRS